MSEKQRYSKIATERTVVLSADEVAESGAILSLAVEGETEESFSTKKVCKPGALSRSCSPQTCERPRHAPRTSTHEAS
jgi:hypothetical protein